MATGNRGWLLKEMFYVYTWTDPRCGSVFYVGKGTKTRAWTHLAHATAGLGVNTNKIARVAEIIAADLVPNVTVVATYDDEGDAYGHERDLIASTDGLTNILSGYGWKITKEEVERRAVERQKRIEARKAVASIQRLREFLAVWDKWPGCVFPNIKNGLEHAQNYVRDVRAMVAAYDADPNILLGGNR